MSVKFVKRAASEILGRGKNAIRFRPEGMEDIKKAITRDDVRRLIKDGTVIALKPRYELHKKAVIERSKGIGKRKGTAKARIGRGVWEKKTRSQRLLLNQLKMMGKFDNTTFKRYYLLVKGNAFPDKKSLLLHLSDDGIKVSDDEVKKINDYAKSMYK
jgi:large subunit ribosomal protein L19e